MEPRNSTKNSPGLLTTLQNTSLSVSPKLSQSQNHIATDGQSVSIGVEPHLGLMTRYLLLFDNYGIILWGALSDERTGLSFVYAAGLCQRSLFRVRVPWDSRPYFTISDLSQSRLSYNRYPLYKLHTDHIENIFHS
jgi:hypothetical protein